MPYELIGKIVVWVVLLPTLVVLVASCYCDLCNQLRGRLVGWYNDFSIERGFNTIDNLCDQMRVWINPPTPPTRFPEVGDHGLRPYKRRDLLVVIAALLMVLVSASVLVPLGFLELAVRYVIHRFHKTPAPSALA